MSDGSLERPYLFLSYALADRERVLAIANRLEDAGLRVWIDRAGIAGGASWGTEIVAGIERCAVFAVCCTAAAMVSRNVAQEVQIAWESKRPYLPLLLEPVEIPRQMRYFLTGFQWVELFGRPDDTWLPDVLRALAGLGVDATKDEGRTTIGNGPVPQAPTNLPDPLTRCLGREREISEIRALIDNQRLVTLTGAGGSGKTRLAIEVAKRLLSAFPDGVFFVDLAPVSDPAFVLSAIGSVLDVRETPERPIMAALKAFLAGKRLLLVLDNLEQVPAAAPALAELIAASPNTRVIITSRVLLHIRGEQDYPVAPLLAPEAGKALPLAALAALPAVALFVERAASAQPGFRLDEANAGAIAGICARLDGLPLAIELAAARSRSLAPAQLLARLGSQVSLLGGSGGDRPARQQTIRSTIAWSYDLLTPAEQALFRQLAVFAGGWTLETAEAVCGDAVAGEPVLDLLVSLVDQSLVIPAVRSNEETRYRMLEPIRQYAEERLTEAGERDELCRMHAGYFRKLASDLGPKILGPENSTILGTLETELPNLRAALTWFAERDSPEPGLRVVAALTLFWPSTGHSREGRAWFERLLARASGGAVSEAAWSNGLLGLGLMLVNQGEYEATRERLDEALASYEVRDHQRGLAVALVILGSIDLYDGIFDRADARLTRAYHLAQAQVGMHGPVVGAREGLGYLAIERGDLNAAREWFEENLNVAVLEGEGNANFLAASHVKLGLVAIAAGDVAEAARRLRTVGDMIGRTDIGTVGIAEFVAALAQFAGAQGEHDRAARLFGAEAAAFELQGAVQQPARRRLHDRAVAVTRAALGEAAYQQAWQAGHAMSPEAAIADGLAGLPA